ncbi:MAG TPA: LysR family transcriptional regulator [Candidatus Hydrogenedentes bacterium]|nr:LysR family transcriptional regulator [Candidatus Hydrogenedentota bacterium]HQH53388.1 LysR family transcriptional regulator [Candidatus Hydrogenedentota bacterium]HQM50565.1 LysR family transcriptional regulator [Candidatus Hydrogenedentota bacterium]
MNLEALRCFCAVIEEESFRKAAERLRRSQPAISQQVKALEKELGHLLLERKTCRLTPVGSLLYDRARHILNETESLSRELEDFDETQAGELRVGTSDTTALYVLPEVVLQFALAMPQTHLVMVNRPSHAIAEQVARGELDLGIVTLPVDNDELIERDLFEQQLVLVVPSNHALASRNRVNLSELSEEPFLMLNPHTRTGTVLQAFFTREAFAPQVVLDSGSFEVIKRYVGEGIGVAFLPSVAITPEDRGLAIVHVPGLPRVRIGVIQRRHAYHTKAEMAFLELLHAHRARLRGKGPA